MKTKKKKKKTSKRYTKTQINLGLVAKVVALILLVPLVGNYTITGWNWGLEDFVFASIMLFTAGVGIEYAVKKITNPTHRVAAILTIIFAFLLIWVEAAVGIWH
jgi:hypothetical protein